MINSLKTTLINPLNAPKSIRYLLIRSLFISIVIFLIIFSFVLIWVTQKGASSLIVNNAQETAHVLAKQGAFALLTDSAENAENVLQQVAAFPDVVGAGLILKSGEMLVWQGDEVGKAHFSQQNWQNLTTNEIISETEDYWHISTTVLLTRAEEDSEQLNLYESSEESLGYAVVSFSKHSLQDISHDLFVTISIACFFVIVGLPLVVIVVTRRLLFPLQKLSDVMSHNHGFKEHKKADVGGAKEIQLIAQSFNSMMKTLDQKDEKLRTHRDSLETKILLRTKELLIARDAALTSSRHKSEFLANITHELRSPIQSIIGYVELVKEEAENEGLIDIVTDLDKVTRNAERLYALINSVLDLSKVEAGQMEINKQRTSISQLLVDLDEATSPLAIHNNNSFNIVNQCADIEVNIDTEKTLQILINFVSNALKFTENGKVELVVSTNNEKLTFEVSDSGIGIPAGELSTIFNQFQQVDGSDSRRFGGTGLGLAISKQFSDMMLGQIKVKSELGKGSNFYLTLPL